MPALRYELGPCATTESQTGNRGEQYAPARRVKGRDTPSFAHDGASISASSQSNAHDVLWG